MMRALRTVLVCVAVAVAVPLLGSSVSAISSDAAEIELQMADLLFRDGRYIDAFDTYQRVEASEDPHVHRRALIGSIRSALRLADYAHASEDAAELMRNGPRDAEGVALYGDALWAMGLFEEAEAAFRDALALQPNESRALHGFARSLASRGRLGEALERAQAALQLGSQDGEIHHTIGSIYEQMDRYPEAVAAYSRYVDLLPNKDRSAKGAWARAEIRFLRAWGRRIPNEMDGRDAKAVHTVPFKLADDKIVVKGRVNGGPEMDFVVDTGSERTVITYDTSVRMNIPALANTLSAGVGDIGLRGLQLTRLESLQIGDLRIKNVPTIIKNPPLRGMPNPEGESISPLALGLSMIVDYDRQQLIVGRSLPPETMDVELPLHFYRLATVRGQVEGGAANFIVDTGGQVVSISTETARALEADSPPKPHIPLKVYGTSGWDRDAFLLPSVDLTFSQIELRNLPVVVLNLRAPSVLLGFRLGGIVGHKFLSQYRVLIDLGRSVVGLKRRAGAGPAVAG